MFSGWVWLWGIVAALVVGVAVALAHPVLLLPVSLWILGHSLFWLDVSAVNAYRPGWRRPRLPSSGVPRLAVAVARIAAAAALLLIAGWRADLWRKP